MASYRFPCRRISGYLMGRRLHHQPEHRPPESAMIGLAILFALVGLLVAVAFYMQMRSVRAEAALLAGKIDAAVAEAAAARATRRPSSSFSRTRAGKWARTTGR